MTIVGVICVMMMTIIKPNERYIPYAYYSAYDALSTAVYNINQDAINNLTYGDDTIPEDDKYFPGARDSYEKAAPLAPKELCKKLANNPNEDDDYGYINTSEYYCSDKAFGSNPEQYPKAYNFRATNSMKFWISGLRQETIMNSLTNEEEKDTRLFIVWVDLNGDRKPNTTKSTASRPADIVPFLIFTNGNVVPIGNPISDTRYMTARIKYPGAVTKYSTASYSFAEAQLRAYGRGKEFPSYDTNSIHQSIYTELQLNENDVETIDYSIELDEDCKYEEGYPPSCTIVVDENKKL